VTVYRLHGLTVQSDVPVDTATVGAAESPIDLHMRRAPEATVPEDPAAGRILADHGDGDRRWYAVSRSCSGDLHCRFPGLADVTSTEELTTLTVTPDPTADPGIVDLVAWGAPIAALLTLAGECVLHASAVDIHGRAIAIAGPSGAGKTTLAAALCREGARLAADDLLRIDLTTMWCFRGTTALRLRPNAAVLAANLPGHLRHPTADGRCAAHFAATQADALPLAAVLVPRWSSAVGFRYLRGVEAVMALAPAARVQGWRDPDAMKQWFEHTHAIATAIPVIEASLPPPADMPHDLLLRLGDFTG